MASRKPQSAGLLLSRGHATDLEVLLAHPGGPFWQNKDDGAWSIPKGLIGADEVPLSAARREFAEETARHIKGIRLWITNEYEHNALRADGERVLDRLIAMVRGNA